jgi:hypothetical protein
VVSDASQKRSSLSALWRDIQSMIDLETARKMVFDKILVHYEPDLQTPAVILDDKTEEFAWGWIFYWEPKDPDRVPAEEARWGYFPILVNRRTGRIRHVGTAGIKAAIAALLWDQQTE